MLVGYHVCFSEGSTDLLARLRTAARLAEKVSKDNLELFTEEALRIVSRGYTGCC